MRLAVLTDASCDLPESFLRHHGVEILPSTIRIENRLVLDERDPYVSLHLYREGLKTIGSDIEVLQPTFDQIRKRITDRLIPRYDYLLCIAPDATQSPVHRNLTRAAFSALNETSALMREGGTRASLGLRVIDARATSAALGLIVAEACRLIAEGVPLSDVVTTIEDLRGEVASFLVPSDTARIDAPQRWRDRLAHALGRRPILHRQGSRYAVTGRARGTHGAVEQLLLLTAAEIRCGVSVPHVVISYGGDPADILSLPGFEQLSLAAQEHKVTLLPAMMSVSRALAIGSGCMEVAYVPRLVRR
ncbi:MAG: DegV family protein [Hydrocarboniphaga sp.]|uniref:DegV family protein n=1 Tax=Hydrocarboniphaga sp. TaxID=2033016 RepID=UPI0026298569|nr:DegV family protein [Hydrocarboniphaga sp.]MDB5968576.1 DegV family protein [Hydrocarboniphaga sp.]